jgi:DeoR/GlpR family transcriptional regulator of sugar metabolism
VQRQDRIAELVLQQSYVAAKDLAEGFGVSLITIHRDLDELEARGVRLSRHTSCTRTPYQLLTAY